MAGFMSCDYHCAVDYILLFLIAGFTGAKNYMLGYMSRQIVAQQVRSFAPYPHRRIWWEILG